MSAHLHILGISGSLRAGSLNTALLRNAQAMLPAHVSLSLADLSGIPLFNQDLEHAPPEAVQTLKAQIAGADALLFAVPEYNYSLSGVLKNAIDWVSRPPEAQPFAGKPAAVMSAGGRFGGVRAQAHFRQIAAGLEMLVMPKPELLIPQAKQKFNSAGELIDPEACDQLRAFIEAFMHWIKRLRQEHSAAASR
jgi:chromate reductase